ncbi:hypothetical protein [Kangiella spongicola]|uniref:Uncharacterized protein n=1 Tax=Kangiella spongicola TaxID=796379 RepID=A0A318D711_9GAMM|nr:hypothetical protein [Kangiella spongicola]PXF64603.1 hypothetical protein DL796_05570 [Kangiella spongicola]
MKNMAILLLGISASISSIAKSDDNNQSNNDTNVNWDAVKDWTGDGTIDSRDVEYYYTNHSDQGTWPHKEATDGFTYFVLNPNYKPPSQDHDLAPYTFDTPKYIKLSGSINYFVQPNSDEFKSNCGVGELTIGC